MVSLKSLFRLLVLCLFIYGQIGSTSHAHEHEHDTQHSVCEFCILKISEDDIVCDVSDLPDDPDYLGVMFGVHAADIKVGSPHYVPIYTAPQPVRYVLYAVSPRAPPSKTLLS